MTPLDSGEGVNYHSHMDINDAARQATAGGRRKVLVQAMYESKPTHRCLMWDGERPYVVIGTRQARHREYLTGFRSLYDGALFIFTSTLK